MSDIADVTVRVRTELADSVSQLRSLADAVREAGAAPDTRPAVQAIENIGDAAQSTGKSITEALEKPLPDLNVAPAVDALQSIGDAAIATGKPIDDLGEKIASLLASGAAATSAEALAQALGQIGDAAAEAGSAAGHAAEQLSLFDEAIQVPYADAAGQLNLFATELEPIAGAAQSAAQAAEQLANATQAAGDAADTASAGALRFSEGAQAIIDAQAKADAELEQAKANLAEIQAAYELGAVSAETLARAQQEVESAAAAANPELKRTGENAHEAEGGIGALAEKLTALGEALVVTEGLKEFGLEALAASDNITRASISLTAITGSGEKAAATIEEIEKLAVQDALSIPSLLTAATRMQNFLGAGAPVPELLARIADGAAVSGRGIDSAATAFDRLVQYGNVSMRTLDPLGLNLEKLAAAMNKVKGATDVTAESVKKAFKDIDDEKQRIEILQTALSGFSGIAQKAAEQTFGGQWQILANQWEQVMRQVGDVLLPVITDLTDLMKIDILPFLKDLVDGFRSLPEPLQQFAVVAGLGAAAIVPLTAGAAAFLLAIEGGKAAIGIFSELVEMLGLKSAATAVEEEAAAAATTHLGEAAAAGSAEANVTGAAFSGLAGIVGLALVTAITAAIAGFADLKAAMANTREEQEKLNAAFQKYIADLPANAKTHEQIAAAMDKVTQSMETGALKAAEAEKVLELLRKKEEEVTKTGFGEALSDYGVKVQTFSSSLTAAEAATEAQRVKMQALRDAVDEAKNKLVETTAGFNDHKKSAGDVTAAYDKFQSATSALKSAQESLLPVVTNVHRAIKDFDQTSTQLPTHEQEVASQTEAVRIKMDSLWTKVTDATIGLKNAVKAFDALPPSMQATEAAMDRVNAASGRFKTAWEELWKAIGAPPPVNSLFDSNHIKTLEDMGVKLAALTPPLTQLQSDFVTLGLNIDGTSRKLRDGYIPAFDDMIKQAGVGWPAIEEGWTAASRAIQQLARTDLPAAVEQERLHTQALIDKHAPLTAVATALDEYESSINRLARIDLPNAVAQQENYIGMLKATGAPQHEILQAQKDLDRMEIQLAEDRHQGASRWIIDLANIEQKIKDQQQSVKNLAGNVYKDLLKAWNDAFDKIGAAIADNIVEAKSWGDVWKSVLKEIEKEILEGLIKNALGAIRSALDDVFRKIAGQSGTTSGPGGTQIPVPTTNPNKTAKKAGPTGTKDDPIHVIVDNMPQQQVGGGGTPGSIIGGVAGSILGGMAKGGGSGMIFSGFPGAGAGGAGGLGGLSAGLGAGGSLAMVAGFGIPIAFAFDALTTPKSNPPAMAQAAFNNGWNLDDPKMRAAFERVFGQMGDDWKEILNDFHAMLPTPTFAMNQMPATMVPAPTADQIAGATGNLKEYIANITAQSENAYNNMVKAINDGNMVLAAKYETQFNQINQTLGAYTGLLEQIGGNTGEAANTLTGIQATSEQSADALQKAQDNLNSLKDLQKDLQQQLIVAEANGDQARVQQLLVQLQAVGSKISDADAFLKLIEQYTGKIALTADQQLLLDRETAKALGPASLADVAKTIDDLIAQQADLEAQLEAAIQAGDTDLADQLVVQLDGVNTKLSDAREKYDNMNNSIQANTAQSQEVAAATKAMEEALKTGDIAAIDKAAADLQAAMGKQPDAIAKAESDLMAAIMSGNTERIMAALKALQDAEAAQATAANQEAEIQNIMETFGVTREVAQNIVIGWQHIDATTEAVKDGFRVANAHLAGIRERNTANQNVREGQPNQPNTGNGPRTTGRLTPQEQEQQRKAEEARQQYNKEHPEAPIPALTPTASNKPLTKADIDAAIKAEQAYVLQLIAQQNAAWREYTKELEKPAALRDQKLMDYWKGEYDRLGGLISDGNALIAELKTTNLDGSQKVASATEKSAGIIVQGVEYSIEDLKAKIASVGTQLNNDNFYLANLYATLDRAQNAHDTALEAQTRTAIYGVQKQIAEEQAFLDAANKALQAATTAAGNQTTGAVLNGTGQTVGAINSGTSLTVGAINNNTAAVNQQTLVLGSGIGTLAQLQAAAISAMAGMGSAPLGYAANWGNVQGQAYYPWTFNANAVGVRQLASNAALDALRRGDVNAYMAAMGVFKTASGNQWNTPVWGEGISPSDVASNAVLPGGIGPQAAWAQLQAMGVTQMPPTLQPYFPVSQGGTVPDYNWNPSMGTPSSQKPPSYDLGGFIPHTGLIFAHAGEWVLTPDEVRAATDVGGSVPRFLSRGLAQRISDESTHSNLTLGPINIYGAQKTSRQLAEEIYQELPKVAKLRTPRAAHYSQ